RRVRGYGKSGTYLAPVRDPPRSRPVRPRAGGGLEVPAAAVLPGLARSPRPVQAGGARRRLGGAPAGDGRDHPVVGLRRVRASAVGGAALPGVSVRRSHSLDVLLGGAPPRIGRSGR